MQTDEEALAYYYPDGTRIPDDEVTAYFTYFEEVIEAARGVSEDSDVDMSVRESIRRGQLRLNHETDARSQPVIESMINTQIEHEFSGSAEMLSAWWVDSAESYDGGDVLFPDGYDWLPNFLAEGLDIRLSTPVERVEYGANGVTVTAGDQSFNATYAVISVPLGVLKQDRIVFAPALPPHKREAIDRLGMGILNKLYLRFETAFWDTDADWIHYTDPDQRGQWNAFVNMQRAVNEPVLLCFNGADFGAAVESLTDEEIVAGAMATLRTIYGSDIPLPTSFMRSSWKSDPYAYGAYSYYAVGSSPADSAALAESVNDLLFFAGEATRRDHPATVHGALLSGWEAAAAILDDLG